jgi:hypothetical protein
MQRKTAELASAGNTNTPSQLSLVARALISNLEILRAVGPAAIALYVALGAGEAVIGGASSGSTSSALADRRSAFDRNGLLGERGRHVLL